jgi:hypothetical protein
MILWVDLFSTLVQIGGLTSLDGLLFSAALGGMFALLLYFRHDREILQYDDTGYRINKGTVIRQSGSWAAFKECGLIKYRRGSVVLRLFTDQEDEFVDIDSAAFGLSAQVLKNFVEARIESIRDRAVALCSNCGWENLPENEYCAKCGTKLADLTRVW